MKSKFNSVEDYLSLLPENSKMRLNAIRTLILKNVPGVEESIAYNMPAYKTHGRPLIYFAAFKTHIGLYATPSGHATFGKELSKYKSGKGSVQFPLDEELPMGLIEKIIEFRKAENDEKYG